jgi:hypothetical protein
VSGLLDGGVAQAALLWAFCFLWSRTTRRPCWMAAQLKQRYSGRFVFGVEILSKT